MCKPTWNNRRAKGMLKLIYTERNFCLEYLTQPLEAWVAQRVILAMRVGECLCFEPSTASFLLPIDLPGIEILKAEVDRNKDVLSLSICDAEYLEVTFRGSWISDGAVATVGIFVTTLCEVTEVFLCKLWQEAQVGAPVMSD